MGGREVTSQLTYVQNKHEENGCIRHVHNNKLGHWFNFLANTHTRTWYNLLQIKNP